MTELRSKRVTVAGLGRFGGQIAASRWLVKQGAKVLVTDRDGADLLCDSIKQLEGLPLEYHLGGHRIEDFTQADLVVASPALQPHNEFLRAARQAGVPVTTEIRLFVERCPATIIGITGTKGKSTATALLGEMLRTKFEVWVGGNIGRSLLPDLARIDKRHLVVLELSSFMLEYLGEMHWSPHISIVTMLAAAHVDWHGSPEAYVKAKANIVRHQRPDDFALLNGEDPASKALAPESPARKIYFPLAGSAPFELLLPGRHNQLNAQAAYAAASLLGIERNAAQQAVRNFRGLPHRIELVHEREGRKYYNDSIATIPEAAIAALESFPPKTVIQIVGGKDSGLPFTALCNALAERAKAVLCVGATGKQIAETIGRSPFPGTAAVYDCGDLATAMAIAERTANPGDVVLLSPGCASYDQFVNFEVRGAAFASLAREGEASTTSKATASPPPPV